MFEVREIRRYPVKAMGGESLPSATIDARGLELDRWYAVVDAEGHLAAGKNTQRFRRRDPVFAYAAAASGQGVDVRRGSASWAVGDPALDAELSRAMDTAVRVLPEAGVPHQDGGQVSLVGTASLRWCEEHLGVDADRRRLRANLVVETDEPFCEESWADRLLRVGGAELCFAERIERCRVVDLAQDGVATTTRLLKALGGARDVCLGVYLDVVTPGSVSVGDRLALSPDARPALG